MVRRTYAKPSWMHRVGWMVLIWTLSGSRKSAACVPVGITSIRVF
jgi:hypothetical protein